MTPFLTGLALGLAATAAMFVMCRIHYSALRWDRRLLEVEVNSLRDRNEALVDTTDDLADKLTRKDRTLKTLRARIRKVTA